GHIDMFQFDTLSAAAAALALPGPGLVDEDATHGLGGGGKEVAAVLKRLAVIRTDQAQIRLVDQRRRLERLARPLLGQTLRREPTQLVVDERQKLCGGRGIALFDSGENLGHFAHEDRVYPGAPRWANKK